MVLTLLGPWFLLCHISFLPYQLSDSILFPADPDCRPAMHSVMVHPVWWPAPQRLAFLIAVSDRVEGEDRAVRMQLHLSCVHASPLFTFHASLNLSGSLFLMVRRTARCTRRWSAVHKMLLALVAAGQH